MNIKLCIVFLLFGYASFSQTTFQPGYLILSNGNQIDCLIKNQDWKSNPKEFEYKMAEDAAVQIGKLATVKEFGIANKFKYLRATVQIDRSNDQPADLSIYRNPIFKEEQLFLKTLIEGKASLFSYEDENLMRYFLQMDGGEIEQLIYKRYLVSRGEIGKNTHFKQQLALVLTCDDLNSKTFEDLRYMRKNLMQVIQKFNSCENSESIIYEDRPDRHWFNLSIRPGIHFSSLSISNSLSQKRLDFGQKTGLRMGLEAEFILPFHNNKWALFIEPAYRSYKAEQEVLYVNFPTIQKTTTVTVDYNSIEFPVGVRHYFFLNDRVTIFVNGAILIEYMFDSKIESSNENSYDLDLHSWVSSAFGLGFKYDNKYSLEARLQPSKNIFHYTYWSSSYNSFAIILGYNLL